MTDRDHITLFDVALLREGEARRAEAEAARWYRIAMVELVALGVALAALAWVWP